MKTIDWTKWSAMAEIFSAVAIFMTLVYLGIQTRTLSVQTQQNTEALLAAARQAALDAELDILYAILDKPYLYPGRFPEIPDTDYDRDRLAELMTLNLLIFRSRENFWLQYRSGTMDADIWETYRGVLVSMLTLRVETREAWKIYAGSLNPAFVEEIEGFWNP
jgi:hypothetical protein